MRPVMQEEKREQIAVEPSEEDLRELLEAREREQAVGWRKLNRASTWILLLAAAAGLGAFLSSGSNRADLASMFREQPAAPPAAVPAVFAAAVENPDEEALKRAAGIPTRAEEAKRKDGKIIDQEDIKFAMDLMQFMQGPAAPAPDGKTGK